MESIKLDIKLVLGMAAIIAGLGGFYYTTQMRLDNIEQEISELHSEIAKTNKLIRRKSK